jgi:hypothetical protein
MVEGSAGSTSPWREEGRAAELQERGCIQGVAGLHGRGAPPGSSPEAGMPARNS